MNPDDAKYEIRVSGHLDRRWSDWFEGLDVTRDFDANGSPLTVLSGNIVDQSALHGTLAIIRDIGIPIVSIKQIMPD